MTTWLVTPTCKKAIIEQQYWTKGDNTLVHSICWRGGSFYVKTEDDTPPLIEEGDDILTSGEEADINEVYDACSTENDWSECDEETQEWLNQFLVEEGHNVIDLEEHGWQIVDNAMIVNCSVEIAKHEGPDDIFP